MKSVEEFLRENERRETSVTPPYPSPRDHTYNCTLPLEVLRVSNHLKWRLFPVQRGMYGTQKALLKDATSDQEQLEKLAAEHPGCPFALATGRASGVFSIEIKGELGRNALRVLAWDDWDWWQQTLLLSTGDGVGQGFFCWPAEFSMQMTLKQIAPGLRLRGENDFVLLPPAIVSGIPYRWLNTGVSVAEAPENVINHIVAIWEKQASWKSVPRFPKLHGSAPGCRAVASFSDGDGT
jgi:hypothetical protein